MTTRKLFITGTDTGVGKTWVACWLARKLAASGLRVGAYKPVCSGAIPAAEGPVWDDIEQLHAALDGRFPRERIGPQRFLAPLAPPQAARLEGRAVDEALLIKGACWWDGQVDVLLIEGAGGWLSPVSDHLSNADAALQLADSVVIVAANRLGVINHTRLTVESVRRRGLPLKGVILNQLPPATGTLGPADLEFARQNAADIEASSGGEGAPVLATLPWDDTSEAATGRREPVDWLDFSGTA